MELDDSFTEKLIERTKARREFLNSKMNELGIIVGKKRAALIEEQQVINQDAAADPPEESPKRQCLETSQNILLDNENEKENIQIKDDNENILSVPFHASSKPRGLAALRKNDLKKSEIPDDRSIFMKTSSDSQVNKCSTYLFSTNSSDLCSSRKSRFTNLAADIKQWEDDTSFSSNLVTSSNISTKLPNPSHVLSNNPSKSHAVSMKLYYSNKASTDTNSVNNLEEKSTHVFPSQINCQISKPKFDSCMPSLEKGNFENGCGLRKQAIKLEAWDQAITATLETQGCVTKPVKSLVHQFDMENENPHLSDTEQKSSSDENEVSEKSNVDDNGMNAVSNAENQPVENISNSKLVQVHQPTASKLEVTMHLNKDPAELPLSARKALFEKALLGGTSKPNESTFDHTLSVAQRAAMFENASRMKPITSAVKTAPKRFIPCTASTNSSKSENSTLTKSPAKIASSIPSNSTKVSSQADMKVSPVKKAVATQMQSTPSPNQNVGSHTRLLQQRLIENASTNWHEKDTIAIAKEQRKQEISSLVNHWEKMSSSNMQISNFEMQQVPEHSNSFEKSDCMAENEEVSESEQSECEDAAEISSQEEMTASDDEEITGENISHANDTSYIVQSDDRNSEEEEKSITVNTGIAAGQNWQQESSSGMVPHRRKSELSSASISLKSFSSGSDGSYYTASRSQSCSSNGSESSYEVTSSETSEGISKIENGGSNPDVPLLYTVSFYRKQKQETRTPPLRTIVRREKVPCSQSKENEDQTQVIQEHIKALQEEILRQQTVISQTSQALNLCSSTEEFSGSTEQVEGERLLLIATQKRQACLNEIQRLKTHGAQGENVLDGKGTLTISDLQLPLKREFMAAQLEGKTNDTVHYFLCLIRHGPQVIVTHMVSTCDKVTDGALCFTNHIKLQNLPADFSVIFEVYALQTKKEHLPHEKKYHIKREHSKIRLTPKGKKADGKFLVPDMSSPGGPSAVRSPSFGVVGFTRFNLSNCNKHCFTLDKVPFTSPLDGILRVKLQLHAEHNVIERGFLTMFEDVSGFGAWHRRWCVLDAHNLAYWKYPDEEQKKEPIGMIDLKKCVTGQVRLVSRDVCARPHTFQLVTIRPQEKGDKNTLISRSVNTLTTTKHLLSADTKEERIMWCNKLNEALTNVRKWDPQALRPVESLQD